MTVLKLLFTFWLAVGLVEKWADPPKEGRLPWKSALINLLIVAAFLLAVLVCVGVVHLPPCLAG